MVNDLYMNRLILRWFESFCRGVRGKVESMLIKNKRSSQNSLNEAGGFLFDKESVQRAQSLECASKFPVSRLNLKIGTKLSQYKFSIFGTSGTKRSDDIKKPMVYGLQLIAIFCVLFSFASAMEAQAQEPRQGGATSQEEVVPLMVGQKVPEEFWTEEHLFYVNGDTVRKNLEEYKGKVLILDFWATWCGGCLAAFPNVVKLQEEHKNGLKVLLINSYVESDNIQKIDKVLSDKRFFENTSGTSIIYDSYLKSTFPHRAVPHYAWIDHHGRVRAITISEFLSSDPLDILLQRRERSRR